MTTSVDLRLDGAVDHLRLAWQVGETLLQQVPFPGDARETRYSVLLALQELLTNVLRHGFDADQPTILEIGFECTDDCFAFEIRDQAPQFDPTATCDPRHVEDHGEMPAEGGGYGLLIVRTILDDLTYRYRDGWNVVRGVKAVEVGAPLRSSEVRS